MSTRTENRPPVRTDHPQDPHPAQRAEPKAGLSLAQTIGGSLAAATAAALGSRLGVVGTITGAAVVSVIASVAGALYTTSLRHTGQRVSTVLRTARSDRPGRPSVVRPVPRPVRLPTRRVLVGALTVFVLAGVGVTAVEALSGRSLDGTAGGTTVGDTVDQPASRSTGGSTGGPVTTPTPTPTSSATPSATPSTTTPRPSTTPSLSPAPPVSAQRVAQR